MLLIRVHLAGHVGIPWDFSDIIGERLGDSCSQRHEAQPSVVGLWREGALEPAAGRTCPPWGTHCQPSDSWLSWEKLRGFKGKPLEASGVGLHLPRSERRLTLGTKGRKDLVVSRMLEPWGTCKETRSFRALPPESWRSEKDGEVGGGCSRLRLLTTWVTITTVRCLHSPVARASAALLGHRWHAGRLQRIRESEICSHKDLGMVPGFVAVWSQASPFTSLSLSGHREGWMGRCAHNTYMGPSAQLL